MQAKDSMKGRRQRLSMRKRWRVVTWREMVAAVKSGEKRGNPKG